MTIDFLYLLLWAGIAWIGFDGTIGVPGPLGLADWVSSWWLPYAPPWWFFPGVDVIGGALVLQLHRLPVERGRPRPPRGHVRRPARRRREPDLAVRHVHGAPMNELVPVTRPLPIRRRPLVQAALALGSVRMRRASLLVWPALVALGLAVLFAAAAFAVMR